MLSFFNKAVDDIISYLDNHATPDDLDIYVPEDIPLKFEYMTIEDIPITHLNATIIQLERFYRALRTKQFKLLQCPVPPENPHYQEYMTSMKIFYNGKLIALQSHLYNDQHREYVLREILRICMEKWVQFHSSVPEWWLSDLYNI